MRLQDPAGAVIASSPYVFTEHGAIMAAYIDAIKRLMAPPGTADKRCIGFGAKDGGPAE